MTQLAEGLVKRGYEVRVVTAMPNYPQRRIYDGYQGRLFDEEERNGVKIQRSYVWIRPQPGLIARGLLDASFGITSMVQALRGWRPDIVLLTVPSLPICIPAVLLGWLYSCPVILNLQDILPEAAVKVGLLRNKVVIRMLEWLEKFAYHNADSISVIAEGFINNLLNKGVPQDKMMWIPNWVDTREIAPASHEHNPFRRMHHLENKFVVMYSGNIALTQGLMTVIQAAQRLRHIPDIEFVIVGEKKAIATLDAACCELAVSNVTLLEFQPRKILPQMLAAADVSLIVQKANIVSFNLPSKTQVLLASGRPILASVPLSGTTAEAICKSRGGIVVEPESPERLAAAIVDLYSNPLKAKMFGRQGRQYAIEHYSFEEAMNRYEQLFETLLQRHHRPARATIPAFKLAPAVKKD